MKAVITVLVFCGAVAFFALVTGIAGDVQANGFNPAKIGMMLKGEDVQIWAILPIAVVGGLIFWWLKET